MKGESHSHTQSLVVGSTERWHGERRKTDVHLSVQLIVQEDEYPVPEVESWSSHRRSVGHGKGGESLGIP